MTRTAFISAAPPARLGEHVPFDERRVSEAPASPGVYLLYRGHRLVYIGLAQETIRGSLRHHLRAGGACTRSATEFDYETSADPLALHRQYLAVYLHATGGLLPDCNEDVGP
jgi:hypothetical protein